MRRGITFGGEAFNRPAIWFGDRLQIVWLGWRRWRSRVAFFRVREPIPFQWQGFVGPVEVRWWVPRDRSVGMTVTCPSCGSESDRVIYAGLPARLCRSESCRCMFGGAAWLISALPFNGVFLVFEGGYWPALWRWIRGGP